MGKDDARDKGARDAVTPKKPGYQGRKPWNSPWTPSGQSSGQDSWSRDGRGGRHGKSKKEKKSKKSKKSRSSSSSSSSSTSSSSARRKRRKAHKAIRRYCPEFSRWQEQQEKEDRDQQLRDQGAALASCLQSQFESLAGAQKPQESSFPPQPGPVSQFGHGSGGTGTQQQQQQQQLPAPPEIPAHLRHLPHAVLVGDMSLQDYVERQVKLKGTSGQQS